MARDPKRIREILEKIAKIWMWQPDLRLGQLLVVACPEFDSRPFFVEDNDLLKGLNEEIAKGDPYIGPGSLKKI